MFGGREEHRRPVHKQHVCMGTPDLKPSRIHIGQSDSNAMRVGLGRTVIAHNATHCLYFKNLLQVLVSQLQVRKG